jgi:hypothetical protein
VVVAVAAMYYRYHHSDHHEQLAAVNHIYHQVKKSIFERGKEIRSTDKEKHVNCEV